MRKFTDKINEEMSNDTNGTLSTINGVKFDERGFTSINIPVRINIEMFDDIINGILKFFPSEEVLNRYGREKAVQKVVKIFIENNGSIEGIQYMIENGDTLEQIFLDDLSIDPDKMATAMKRINGKFD
tara:strand:- start:60326 stop:60709 length:384 start_codon:yes stop_codon:yes gene_type:complete